MHEAPTSPREYAGELRHRLVFLVEDLKPADKSMIQKALGLAEETHERQTRPPTKKYTKPCAPYIVHPIRVALIILEELELKDPVALSASLLHDVVECKRDKLGIAEIEKFFGRSVAMMVSILTKPEIDRQDDDETVARRMSMYLKRLEQANVVTRLVKLSEHLDLARESLDWLDKEPQQSIVEETRSIYIPLAENTDSYLHDELSLVVEELMKSINSVNG